MQVSLSVDFAPASSRLGSDQVAHVNLTFNQQQAVDKTVENCLLHPTAQPGHFRCHFSRFAMPRTSFVHDIGLRYRMLVLRLRVRALARDCRNLGKGSTSNPPVLFQSARFHCVTVSGECIVDAVGCWRLKLLVPGADVQAPSAQGPAELPR